MKTVKLAVLALLSLMPLPALAQFTIRDTQELELLPPVVPKDKIAIRPDYKFEYVNEALLQEMKRQRRKERNYVELRASLKFQQNSFDNWASGGDNNLNILSNLDFRHTFKITKFSLESTVNAKYGENYVEKEKFKNQDEFKINIKSNWTIHKKWFYSMNGNLRSQFAPGYKNRDDETKRSDFMSPGYLSLSAGITYKEGPLVFLFSPISGNATFVLDDELSDKPKGSFGVESGKRVLWQAGPSLKINYEQQVVKDVLRIRSEMYSFSDMHSNPNFRFDTTFYITSLKILETSLNVELRYDELSNAEKPNSMQYRTAISFGLAYLIKNK